LTSVLFGSNTRDLSSPCANLALQLQLQFFTFTILMTILAAPGEPRPSPKPQPLGGNALVIFLFTTCTLCVLFILWRRAESLRSIVSHRLKTWTRREGTIRLSIDEGPPAREFLEDDYDEDHEGLNDDAAERAWREQAVESRVNNAVQNSQTPV